MAKISRDFSAGTLHPRETLFLAGNLASGSSEVILACDGCSTVSLDLRGTSNLTIEVSGTIDGVNWIAIPMRGLGQSNVGYSATIATNLVNGLWVGKCAPFRQVRARVTAYTSGTAMIVLASGVGQLDDSLQGQVSSQAQSATGASGAAVALTLPAPGAGLRQYITYLSIDRIATAGLTAAATPILVTTTNLPASLAFSIPADAAAQGVLSRLREDYGFPLVSTAQNSATVISAPATTNIIWRLTAGYYVAP